MYTCHVIGVDIQTIKFAIFITLSFPPWVKNVTCQFYVATPKAGVLVFYKCQECVRAAEIVVRRNSLHRDRLHS